MKASNYIPLEVKQVQLITPEQAWHYRIIPKEIRSSKLVFFTDSEPDSIINELEMLYGKEIELIKEDKEKIENTLGRYYRLSKSRSKVGNMSYKTTDSFLPQLIEEAKSLGSSDIHLEPYEKRCRIRIRIDGKLVERYTIDIKEYASIVNKIKIMSNLDIAEKRLPQDGRIFFKVSEDLKFDIRVSVLPTLHGEKIVMRLLGNDATDIDINQLGFGSLELRNYLDGIKKPNGVILISGPTGSGKTTTLYATLKLLNEESRNIVTVEDPIEYTLEGINQVQVKEGIGLGYSNALKTFLRQDPDVIMVGEIRDGETAEIGIRASLTGHLVLSTIHTNSAWDTIVRLVDMGIPSFMVANTLSLSVAQRLLRKLCPDCKKEKPFNKDLYPEKFKPFSNVDNHYIAEGCANCFFTGYSGRQAIYEVITIDKDLSNEIKRENFMVDDLLVEKKVKLLAESAFGLFVDGVTSLEEIYPYLLNS